MMPEKLPVLSSEDDEFTWDRLLIWDQANYVQLWVFGHDKNEYPIHFLVFGRRRRIHALDGYEAEANGLMWGYQCVAYSCDSEGYVENWNERYEAEAPDCQCAINKIKFQRANGLAYLHRNEISTY